MTRSRAANAAATNQSRSVAEDGSFPTASVSLARTTLLMSANSTSSTIGALRPWSAVAERIAAPNDGVWSSIDRFIPLVSEHTLGAPLDPRPLPILHPAGAARGMKYAD